jgi:Co/Zn/Cd efflux system component
MSHENHSHEESKKLLGAATIVNGLLGVGEVIAGISTGSNLLQADALHNAVDTSMYGMKWKLAGNDSKERVNRYRKAIMGIVCLGSLAIGVKSGIEIINNDYNKTPPLVLGVAALAGTANFTIAKKLHDSAHNSAGVHQDGMRHAASDAVGSIITVSCAALAYRGIEVADPAGAITTSAVTIAMNFPTKKRIGIDLVT